MHFYLLIILLGFNSSGERGGRVLVLHMTNLSDLDLKGTQEERHQNENKLDLHPSHSSRCSKRPLRGRGDSTTSLLNPRFFRSSNPIASQLNRSS